MPEFESVCNLTQDKCWSIHFAKEGTRTVSDLGSK